MFFKTSMTRGEHARVFSLKSSRKPSRPATGGWYSFMRRTPSRGAGARTATRSGTGQSPFHRGSVPAQPFGIGQRHGYGSKRTHALGCVALHGHQLEEVHHTE